MLVFSDKGVRLWNPATSKRSGFGKFKDKPADGDGAPKGPNVPAPRPPKFPPTARPAQPAAVPQHSAYESSPRASGSRPPPPPLPPRLPPRPPSYSAAPPIPAKPSLPPRPGQTANLPTATDGILPPASSSRWVAPEAAAPPDVHPPAETTQEEQADLASDVCLKCRDFSEVDEHARQYPRETLAYYGYTIPQLASELTGHLDSATLKARALFAWCADNIVYDVSVYFGGGAGADQRNRSQGAQTVFENGMAVCAGYASIYSELARHAGLECYEVNGYGKGFGFVDGSRPRFESNHAWNAVLLDEGEWHLLDACWGAGAVNGAERCFRKNFDSTMFTGTAEEFGRRHYPSEAGWQLRSDGITQTFDQFLDDGDAPQIFPDFKAHGYAEAALDPARKTLQLGTHTFSLWHSCPHADARARQQDHYLPLLSTGDGQYHPLNWWEGTGCWSITHEVTRPCELHIWYLKEVGGRDARGIGMREYERNVKGRQAHSFGGLVKYVVM